MTQSERRRSLAAAISSIAMFGIGIGISGPLLSLMIEGHGIDPTLNGLNAAASFAGVLVGPLLMPRLVSRLGFKSLLLAAIPLSTACFMLLKVFDSLTAWFVLRFLAGVLGSSVFAATEAWISQLASDRGRGRILGIYTASLSAGFAIGPLVLAATGMSGWPPFLAFAAIAAAALVPLLTTRGRATSFPAGQHPIAIMRRMKPVILIVVLFAMYEGTTVSLLPVWGARAGIPAATAAMLISAVFIGAILLQIPVGYLSDRTGRRTTMRVCAALGMVGALALPALAGNSVILPLALLLWGGFTTGIYPVALAVIGDRFSGGDLINANAAMVVAYGAGALIGPIVSGAAMDAWNPHGMTIVLAAMFAFMLLATWWEGERAAAAAMPL